MQSLRISKYGQGLGGRSAIHLHVAVGLNHIDRDIFDTLYGSLAEVSRMTLALSRYLRENGK